MNTEFATVRCLRRRIIDQAVRNIIDFHGNFPHLCQIAFLAQANARENSGVRVLTAGIRFERILVNFECAVAEAVGQFTPMRIGGKRSAKSLFAFQNMRGAGKTAGGNVGG